VQGPAANSLISVSFFLQSE